MLGHLIRAFHMKNYGLENLKSQIASREGKKNESNRYDIEVSNYKITWYGEHIFRVKHYEIPIFHGFKSGHGRTKKVDDFLENEFEGGIVINQDERKRTEYKIINMIYALADLNFDCDDKFITLVPDVKILDIIEADKYFKKFIQRMKQRKGNFKYLAVIQFQDKSPDNHRVHFHMMWDLQYIPQEDLLQIWGAGKGSVFINKIYDVDNVGAYMLGYMGKSIGDTRLYGHKAYLCSKGLKRPESSYLTDDKFIEFSKKYDLENRKTSYEKKPYESENNGLITEVEYNLKRGV
jgi:hypothetical protein